MSNYKTVSTQSISDTLNNLHSSKEGLSFEVSQKMITQFGKNELKKKEETIINILLRQLNSSFIYLLIFASGISILLHAYIDASMIILFIVANTILGFFQEYRSYTTLKLLKSFITPSAKIRRDGSLITIPSGDIVPGDILLIQAGDIIPADARIIKNDNLIIDESFLSGESMPIHKHAQALKSVPNAIHNATNICFRGTLVHNGSAECVVIATGNETVMGEIGTLVSQTNKKSAFEININKISNFVLQLVAITMVIIFIANLFNPNRELGNTLLFSIALAVSVVPEALPVVVTFSLTRGAMRLANKKVVPKRLSAIEDLGSIDVLCTDKTGTLTENKMTVAQIVGKDKITTLMYAAIASEQQASDSKNQNPFDHAILQKINQQKEVGLPQIEKTHIFPFDPDRKRNSCIIKEGDLSRIITRGAAEMILHLCTNMTVNEQEQILSEIKRAGSLGYRTLAIATRTLKKGETTISAEKNLTLIGLIAFEDPVKKTTHLAVQRAQRLGIDLRILTGDSKEVALTVAKQIRLEGAEQGVISGDEFEKLQNDEQRDAVNKYSVFARVTPAQKYRIIELLQEKHTVGYLGDGINDTPALKLAHVSIAVKDATDIARETADIILLKKSLLVIVDGIQEGREIFSNTANYIKATLSANFGNFYAIAITSIFTQYLPMLPLQILLVNLLSDFPMIAMATDNADKSDLKKPKAYDIREIGLFASAFGALSCLFDFLYFAIFKVFSVGILQTGWFIESILTELIFIFSIRTKKAFLKGSRPSKNLIALTGIAATITLLLPFIPQSKEIFKFANLKTGHVALILLITIAYFAANELLKKYYYRLTNGSNHKTPVQQQKSLTT